MEWTLMPLGGNRHNRHLIPLPVCISVCRVVDMDNNSKRYLNLFDNLAEAHQFRDWHSDLTIAECCEKIEADLTEWAEATGEEVSPKLLNTGLAADFESQSFDWLSDDYTPPAVNPEHQEEIQ